MSNMLAVLSGPKRIMKHAIFLPALFGLLTMTLGGISSAGATEQDLDELMEEALDIGDITNGVLGVMIGSNIRYLKSYGSDVLDT